MRLICSHCRVFCDAHYSEDSTLVWVLTAKLPGSLAVTGKYLLYLYPLKQLKHIASLLAAGLDSALSVTALQELLAERTGVPAQEQELLAGFPPTVRTRRARVMDGARVLAGFFAPYHPCLRGPDSARASL